jgi:iron complex outermembrane recepter protein
MFLIPISSRCGVLVLRALATSGIILGASLHAQPTPAEPSAEKTAPLLLSPFEVAGSTGYAVTNSASVTRTNMATIEVPFSVNVITSELLADTGAISIEDATRYAAVGAATSSGNLGNGRVNTRGYTTNDTKRNGFVLRASAVLASPYTDRIEIIKGPASVLYGIGRPGGSVNVITKQPLAQKSAALKATVGSFDLVNVDVDVGGPMLGGKVRTRFVANYYEQGSFADNVFAQRKFVGAGFSWLATPNTKISLDFNYNDTKGRRIPHAPVYANAVGVRHVVANLPRNFTVYPDRRGFVSTSQETSLWFTLIQQLGDGWVFRSAIESVNLPQDRRERFVNGNTVNADGVTLTTNDQRRLFFDRSVIAQNDVTKTFVGGGFKNQILVGFQYEYSKFVNTEWGATLNPAYPIFDRAAQAAIGSAEPTIWGGYATATVDRDRRNQSPSGYAVNQLSLLDDKLKLLAGGRYERNHEIRTARKGAAASNITYPFKDYQLGVTYLPTKNLSVYASMSTASKNNVNFPSNPEHGKGREGGVKYTDPRQKFSGSVSYFHIEEQDIEKSLGAGVFALSGLERSRGYETEMILTPVREWQAILSYAYVETKVLSDITSPTNQGQHLADAPRNVFTFWNRYNLTPELGVGAGLRHQDKTRIGGTRAFFAPVTVFDVALYYHAKWAGRACNVQLNVLNVADRFYGTSGEVYQPREFRLSVGVKL